MERVHHAFVSILLSVLVVLAASQGLIQNSRASSSLEGPVCGVVPRQEAALNNLTFSRGARSAYYDTQLWLVLNRSSTKLVANVTAVPQNDTYGFGPGYILNGLTNGNLWYQVGVAWNWPGLNGATINPGFGTFVEVWNVTSGESIYPVEGGSSLTQLGEPVHSGDKIGLSLNISKGAVTLATVDWMTGSEYSLVLPDSVSTVFLGFGNTPGYSTSLMTEWYHVLPYLCSDQKVYYTFPKFTGTAWLGSDEWNFTGVPPQDWFNSTYSRSIFHYATTRFLLRSNVESLSLNGTVIYCNATTFLTE